MSDVLVACFPQDALELLERYYQHLDHKQGDTRALAYRQASCVLKALPK